MENNSNDSANNNGWVDEQMATLAPPSTWQPDSNAALSRLAQGRQPPKQAPVQRLMMAAAILLFAGAVFSLLPWKVFWNPSQPEAAGVEAETPSPALVPAAAAPVPEPPPQSVRIPEVRPADPPRLPTVQPAPSPVTIQKGEPEQPEVPVRPKKEVKGPTQPKLISRVDAVYTAEAREARLQGSVELLLLIRDDGTVEVREVTRSLGYGLDESAVAAASQWRFEPARKDGQPVPVFTSVLIHFTLR